MLLVSIICAMIGATMGGWVGSFIGGFVGAALYMAYAATTVDWKGEKERRKE